VPRNPGLNDIIPLGLSRAKLFRLFHHQHLDGHIGGNQFETKFVERPGRDHRLAREHTEHSPLFCVELRPKFSKTFTHRSGAWQGKGGSVGTSSALCSVETTGANAFAQVRDLSDHLTTFTSHCRKAQRCRGLTEIRDVEL